MQNFNTPTKVEGASLSRRSFITFAAAGSATTLPVVAHADAGVLSSCLRQPLWASLDDQLDVCLAQLRSILQHKHPHTEKVLVQYNPKDDGSFGLYVLGEVTFQPFQGDGIYLVSKGGWVWEYLIREEPLVTLSGKSLGYSHYWGRARADDGGWDDRETLVTNFVRKIEGVSA